MGTPAPGGRIDVGVVDEELGRLRDSWRGPRPRTSGEDLLPELLGPARVAELDRFDRVQLAEVLDVCRRSRTLADAGRELFAVSRLRRSTRNDAGCASTSPGGDLRRKTSCADRRQDADMHTAAALAVLPVVLANCAACEAGNYFGDDDDAAPVFDPALADALDETLQEQLDEFGPPGIVAAVQMPDGTAWLGAVGDADLDGTPLDGTEFFKVASVTKSFVAGLVLATGVDLEATIDPWIAHPRASEIRVRQLLNHTAGVPEFSTTAAYRDAGLREWTDAELIALVEGSPLAFEPGASYGYSNTHFVMLSMIVEAEGGAPWQDQLEVDVLDPLALTETFAPDGADGWGDVVRGVYAGQDLTDSIRPSGIGGAGNVVSTAENLARWGRGLWGGELLGDPAAELWEGAIEIAPGVSYGLGTLVLEDDSGTQHAHNGALNGYVSWVGYRPEQDVGLAVLANGWLPGNPPGVGYSTDMSDALWAEILEILDP